MVFWHGEISPGIVARISTMDKFGSYRNDNTGGLTRESSENNEGGERSSG